MVSLRRFVVEYATTIITFKYSRVTKEVWK
jgi:hypothetical protein